MKLLTKALLQKFDQVGSQESKKLEDHLIVAHYFCVRANRDRYATEYEKGSGFFFGFVNGHSPERGSFSLREFEEINKSKGFSYIERDMFRTPKRFSELRLGF